MSINIYLHSRKGDHKFEGEDKAEFYILHAFATVVTGIKFQFWCSEWH